MPLISNEPQFIELPALLLVGTCSYADFFADQWSLFSETWDRFLRDRDQIEHLADTGRTFGVELYPSGFPEDRRWYYLAATEVTTLNAVFPTSMVSRFLPASRYAQFSIAGPVTELAPAFQQIYDDWLPQSGMKLSGAYDLELYGPRFIDPASADSVVEVLLPV